MGQQSQHNTPPNKAALKLGTKNQAKGGMFITAYEQELAPRLCKKCLNQERIYAARIAGTTLPTEYKKKHGDWCPKSTDNKQKKVEAGQASQRQHP